MSNVGPLESMIHKISINGRWGAYDTKGDRAVNRVMLSVLKTLLTVAQREQSGDVAFSLSKRVAAIEKGVKGFHKAIKSHPNSGLDDTDPRDTVFGYFRTALVLSGVNEDLAREIMRTMPIDSF